MLVPIAIAVAAAAPAPPAASLALLTVLAAVGLILGGPRLSAFRLGVTAMLLLLLLLLLLTLLLSPRFVPLTLMALLVGPRPTTLAMLLSALSALTRRPLPSTIAPPALTLVTPVPVPALAAIL